MVAVVAGKEEGDAEGAQATVLGVGLLVVADGAHELLHGDGLLVLVQVSLRRQPVIVSVSMVSEVVIYQRCAVNPPRWDADRSTDNQKTRTGPG